MTTIATWTLILVLGSQSQAGVSIVVPNLSSSAECLRVEAVIASGPVGADYGPGRKSSQCVEVYSPIVPKS